MIGLAMLMAAMAPARAGAGPVRARALEPIANWFSDRDYPAAALRRERQGVTHFRAGIDPRGNVESCTIVESSGDASLDAATCSIISIRGRFEPARDAAGRAVSDTVGSRVRWVLPDERPPRLPFEPIRFVSSMHVAAGGAITCSTNTSPDARDSMSAECGMFAGSGAARVLRAARTDATITNIFTIVPEGTPVPSGGPADYGRTMVDAEAALSIGADGRVAECRMTAERTPAGPSDICTVYPAGAAMFEPARGPGPLRIVHISMKVYLRGAVADLTP
jgi:TonB family protein